MTNNDVLRGVRYALDISDPKMVEIFKLGGHEVSRAELAAFLKKEDEEDYINCSDPVFESFLDGLIIQRRGKKDTGQDQAKIRVYPLTNNAILKKIRIALELKEEDMLGILKLAEIDISKSELTALFRKKGHKNYKKCGDQFLRNFLKGLSIRYRLKEQS